MGSGTSLAIERSSRQELWQRQNHGGRDSGEIALLDGAGAETDLPDYDVRPANWWGEPTDGV